MLLGVVGGCRGRPGVEILVSGKFPTPLIPQAWKCRYLGQLPHQPPQDKCENGLGTPEDEVKWLKSAHQADVKPDECDDRTLVV